MTSKSLEEGTFLFKTTTNTYLSTDWRGRVSCRAGVPAPSEAWTAKIVVGTSGQVLNLTSTYGKFLCGSAWFNWVVANRTEPRTWEKWRIVRTEDGFVTFQSAHGTFLANDPATGSVFTVAEAGTTEDSPHTHWLAMPCPQNVVRGAHKWDGLPFTAPVWCDFCGSLIWGLGISGFHCVSCGLTVHRGCIAPVGDSCNQPRELFAEQARRSRTTEHELTPEQQRESLERRQSIARIVCIKGPSVDEGAALAAAVKEEEKYLLRRSIARQSADYDSAGFNPFLIDDYAPATRKPAANAPAQDWQEVLFPLEEKPKSPAPAPPATSPPTAPATSSPTAPVSPPAPTAAFPVPEPLPEAVFVAPPSIRGKPLPAVPPEAVAPSPSADIPTKPVPASPVQAPAKPVESPKQAAVDQPPEPPKKINVKAMALAQESAAAATANSQPRASRPKSVAPTTVTAADKERRKMQIEAILKRGPVMLGGQAPASVVQAPPVSASGDLATAPPDDPKKAARRSMTLVTQPGRGGPPAPPPRQPKVEFVGKLGMPVSKAPRLEHAQRSRGPKGRRPPKAL